jgi:hypothetical protein
MATTSTNLPDANSLATLIAIVRAAYLTGDRALERTTRRELRERYGIDLTIRRPKPGSRAEEVPA